MSESVEEKARAIVGKRLNLQCVIELKSSITNDLGADSLDVKEVIMDVEDSKNGFDIEITDEESGKIQTFGDLVTCIENHLKAEGRL